MTYKATSTTTFQHGFSNSRIALPAQDANLARNCIFFKFSCDKMLGLIGLPIILLMSLVLLVLNPFFNPGPLFFTQDRMGMGGRRFKMLKFRTMSVANEKARAHDAPLETHRITPFARYLRKFRIDEFPNFLNVLSGSMSIVGPRPDAWDHSMNYMRDITYYKNRFHVRPGITGLAQVRGGYADSKRSIERKARYDHFYVKKNSIWLDIYIIGLTALVVLTGFGAK
jgi:lipopolysaccharide/colanic/teichoic acid biosynthesis glycosyltransferase